MSLTPIILVWLLAAGSFLTMAVIELAVATLLRAPRVHVAFSLVALFAMAAALAEAISFQAVSIDTMTRVMRIGLAFNIAAHLSFIVFMVQYSGTRFRWPGRLAFGIFAVGGVVHLALPAGITLTRIDSILRIVLPWGEQISLPVGPPHPAWPITFSAIPLLLLFLGDLVIQLHRRGETGRAWRIAIAGAILFAAFVQGFLTDGMILPLPGLSTLSFLGVLALTGEDLARGVVRAVALTRQVSARERRWNNFIEQVQVAVIGISQDGRVDSVNPFVERMLGRTRSELCGRMAVSLVEPAAAAALTKRLAAVFDGQADPHAEWALRGADGVIRTLAWSTVRLTDDNGAPAGLLTIGADVTERTNAQRELEAAVQEITRLRDQLESENIVLREELQLDPRFNEIVGESDALRYVLHRVQQVATTDMPVLLEGETGVGKELVAKAIQEQSERRERAFVRVNCAAIPASLVESELFGHERGSFTGASQRRLGRFELADGGTLFLDEIGELPLEVQPRLLRVLEGGEFTRVGGEKTVRVNVRIIAATNRVLRDEVDRGAFREDLYFRLSTFVVTVPPVRERREDIPLLVSHFVTAMAAKHGREINQVPRGVMERLVNYGWPGNIRELKNVLERSILLSPGPELRLADRLESAGQPDQTTDASPTAPIETLVEAERRHIQRALGRCKGRLAGPGGAAELLGINASTLRSRMKKLGMG